jgi:hypothetical protein
MQHFPEETWIDFIHQLEGHETAQKIEQHLAADCSQCKTAFDIWRQMATFAANESAYAPPENLVRLAKLEFGHAQPAQQEDFTVASLIFDSAAQLLPVGIRSGASSTQQVVYEAEGLNVHLSFERKPHSGTIVATGQVLDAQEPFCWLGNTAVVLWSDKGQVIATVETDGYGEFQLEFKPQDQMRISVASAHRKTVRIPLGSFE